MIKTIPIIGIQVNDDIDYDNINYGSLATIIGVAILFLTITYLMVIL